MKGTFFKVRVAVLLFVLFLVILWAVRDVRSRRARNEWKSTVDVAVVLVHVADRSPVEDEAVRLLGERLVALEDRLAAEATRHRPGIVRPFRLRLLGPAQARRAPPTPASDGFVDLAKQAWALRSWLGEVDPTASVTADHWDTRIYVTAHRPASALRSVVEGQSEQGGRIGIVDVELDSTMVDLALIVVAHELLHTLGASDKYGSDGRASVPGGLAEPDRSPLYPQRYAEIMARNRPVSPQAEEVPGSIAEVAVGALTAAEIGWQ